MSISTERQREILEGTRQNAEEQAFGYAMEKRTQETLLARATASKLRLGKWTTTVKENGKDKPSMGGAPAAIRQRLAQLEFDIERVELVLADIDEQLAALPVDGEGE